jgi:hypothetical protein
MKRFLLWSFDRGSVQYEIMCGAILAFIFIVPHFFPFNDRPDYMRVERGDPVVRKSVDDNGSPVYTVKVWTPVFSANDVNEQAAMKALEVALGMPVQPSKMQPVYGPTGALIAYAVWIER